MFCCAGHLSEDGGLMPAGASTCTAARQPTPQFARLAGGSGGGQHHLRPGAGPPPLRPAQPQTKIAYSSNQPTWGLRADCIGSFRPRQQRRHVARWSSHGLIGAASLPGGRHRTDRTHNLSSMRWAVVGQRFAARCSHSGPSVRCLAWPNRAMSGFRSGADVFLWASSPARA